MSEKYCSKCNARLREGAAFCSKCGAVTAPEPSDATQKCLKCGAMLRNGAGFCSKCGAVVDKKASPAGLTEALRPVSASQVNAAENQLRDAVFDIGGEEIMDAAAVFRKEESLFVSYIRSFRNPKVLITSVLVSVLWIVLAYLDRSGRNNIVTRAASFLTFAKGGTYGNLRQISGGICGKILAAAGICSIVDGGLVSAARGIRGILGKSRIDPGAVVMGLGLGVLLCLYFIGGKGIYGTAVGISGIILSLGAIGNGDPGKRRINGFFAGMSAGFAAAAGLSVKAGLFPWAYIISGAVALIGLMILPVTGKAGAKK